MVRILEIQQSVSTFWKLSQEISAPFAVTRSFGIFDQMESASGLLRFEEPDIIEQTDILFLIKQNTTHVDVDSIESQVPILYISFLH